MSELELSRKFIETVKPTGFRAPWIYLPNELLGVLREWGFKYDSSTFSSAGNYFTESGLNIFPVTSIQYGVTERNAIYPKTANSKMLLKEFPIGSGIFISLFRKIYKPFLQGFQRSKKPVVMYVHDWQLGESNDHSYKLIRDKLRYTHRFPMLDAMLGMVEQFNFRSLNSLLDVVNRNKELPFAHYLTIDVENMED